MIPVQMLQGEEISRLCPFDAWLNNETISSAAVTVTDQAGADQSTQMVGTVAPANSTQAKYLLKGAIVGAFTVRINITTTAGQKLAHQYLLEVK
jgi:hypothetical protein